MITYVLDVYVAYKNILSIPDYWRNKRVSSLVHYSEELKSRKNWGIKKRAVLKRHLVIDHFY